MMMRIILIYECTDMVHDDECVEISSHMPTSHPCPSMHTYPIDMIASIAFTHTISFCLWCYPYWHGYCLSKRHARRCYPSIYLFWPYPTTSSLTSRDGPHRASQHFLRMQLYILGSINLFSLICKYLLHYADISLRYAGTLTSRPFLTILEHYPWPLKPL